MNPIYQTVLNKIYPEQYEFINKVKKQIIEKKIEFIKNHQLEINTNYGIIILFIKSIDNIDNFNLNHTQKITIKNILQKRNFNPEKENHEIISFFENDTEITIAVIGINIQGQRKNHESIKNNFGKIISLIQSQKINSAQIKIANQIFDTISAELFAELLQSTLLLKLYQFNLFITSPKKLSFTDFCITIMADANHQKSIQQGIEKGNVIGHSINFSRYLSDLPAKELFPQSFIDIVNKQIQSTNINADITIFNIEKLTELGMGGILGVGQGSAQEPRLLILKYSPQNSSDKTVALVGKGVTFDTGGISIKPSEGMEDMKSDMSGAAAVVSAFMALSQLECPYTIYAVAPLAENMVDGNSIRPGDILKFYNGKTAEVKNTDAEGRLVLADALSYTSDIIKPDIIIDLATLTGACRIALGPIYAGLMTEDHELEKNIKQAGIITGDRCWALPLESAYEPNMHSDIADMCNIGTKGYKAGATMGGMFLREFVEPTIAWAHIDIATVATDCPFKNYLSSFGATGFGVRLLIELLETKKYLG